MNIRTRRTRAAVLAVPALMIGGLLPSATSASAAPSEGGPPPKIELVLDLSGSMKADDAGGQTRLAAAKQAVSRIIDTTPQDAALGLRVYGATYPGEDKAQGCADTQQLFPVATMDAAARTAAKERVAGMNAVGFTPIGVSLREAAKDIGKDGPRRIILVSDGEDTCAPPPPCDVARELKSQGIDVAVDAVGFKTTGAARDQLKCIAEVSGGSYADADNADALTANLSTLFRKAWTTYQATGTPIKGSIEACADAPMITPGQYLDNFTGGRDLYYKVKKRPDQLLQVSATAVAEDGYGRGAGLTVQAGTIGSGDPDDWLRQYEQSVGWANVISAGARSKPDDGKGKSTPPPDDIGCIMIENKVTKAGDMPMPVELLVGLAETKGGGATAKEVPVKTGPDAVGGFSFNSATPIGPGTYKQSIAVGEAPFWRVDLKAGQQLTVKAGVDIPHDFPGSTTSGWSVKIFNATRNPTACDPKDSSIVKLIQRETGRFERTCGPWQIARPEDAGSFDPNGFAVPGTYYIQLSVAEAEDKAKGLVVPIDLSVEIGGTPRPGTDPVFVFDGQTAANPGSGQGGQAATGGTGTGKPGKGDESVDLPGESAAKKDDESTAGKIALPLGIVAGVALLGGVGYYGLRRR